MPPDNPGNQVDLITALHSIAKAIQDQSTITDGAYLEIARAELSVAGDTLAVTNIPARKYLKFEASLIDTGGTLSARINFNGDASSNYARRRSEDGAAETTATSDATLFASNAVAQRMFLQVEVINIAGQEKLAYIRVVTRNAAGAGSIPVRTEAAGKWVNTSVQIDRIDITNGGTGDFAIGSEIVVYGHD